MLVIQTRISIEIVMAYFLQSDDNGGNFSNLTKINGPIKSIGKPQITS
jgi:hypothetical protein